MASLKLENNEMIYKEYYNDLTQFMDNYLVYKDDNIRTNMTKPAIFYDDTPNMLYSLIIVSGMLRGCIITDDKYIIRHIKLYEDVCFDEIKCYNLSLLDDIKSYIDHKLSFTGKG